MTLSRLFNWLFILKYRSTTFPIFKKKMINLFTKPIHDTALLLIGDKSSINKIVSHSSCRTKYRARRVNHRTSPLLVFPPRKNLNECERIILPGKNQWSNWSISPFSSRLTNLSRRYIWGEGNKGGVGGEFRFRKKSRVRVFTRENDALGARWIDGSIGGGVYRRYKAKSRYGVGYGRTADPETLFGYRQNR